MAQVKVTGQDTTKLIAGEKVAQSQQEIKVQKQMHNLAEITPNIKNTEQHQNREKGFLLDCTKYSRQERYMYNPFNDKNMKVFFAQPRTKFILMDHSILPPDIDYLQKKNSPQNYKKTLNSSVNHTIDHSNNEQEIRQSLPPLEYKHRIATEDDRSSRKRERKLQNKSMPKSEIDNYHESTINKTSKTLEISTQVKNMRLQLAGNVYEKKKKNQTSPHTQRLSKDKIVEKQVDPHLPAINKKPKQDPKTVCIGRETFTEFMKAQRAKYLVTTKNNDHLQQQTGQIV